jgi:hypothetical protein
MSLNILQPSQWTASTDPNSNELQVGGSTYFVQNAGQSWSLTSPAANTLRFEVRPGDVWSAVDPSSKERSEIAGTTTYAQGTNLHVGYGFNVEPGQANNASWLVVGQFHQTAADGFSPPFEIDLVGDKMSITVAEGGNSGGSWSQYHTLYTDAQDIVRGHTYQMQIDADFDPVNGHLSVVRDGVTLVNYSGPLGYSGMGDTYWKEGIYRAASNTTLATDYSNLSVTTGSTSAPTPPASSTPPPTSTPPVSSSGLHTNDFNGDGKSDVLIQNTSGTVVVGEAVNGKESYSNVASLGHEWSFHGAGDFLGDGHSQFLVQNTAGQVDVGNVSGGHASFTAVAALGSEWKFAGAGDYLGDGKSGFLVENGHGQVDVGEVGANGKAAYAQVGALGSEWKIAESGDFLGQGHSQYLMENTAGTVAVAAVSGGHASYANVAALGSEWKFEGAGDFLGDGKSQFLVENTHGAVAVGEVGADGKVSYHTVAGLGSEWKFVGTGDYLGLGHDQFVIQNTSGAYAAADVQSGHAHFTTLGSLGPEWAFHS